MENTTHISKTLNEGMMVSELRRDTSVNYINTLREKELITINRRGELRLTSKGKIANRIGVQHYLHLDENEKKFIEQEIDSIRVENRGLMLIFSGMFISLVLIIGFWMFQLKGF